MTTPEFWEVGASGRRYSREYVFDNVEKRFAAPHEDVWETRDFHCLMIAQIIICSPICFFKALASPAGPPSGGDATARWKIVYHQGTIVADS